MDSINFYSKEAIKARMLQNAVQIWGVANPAALDPFVAMLMDAFSMELFNVSNEIQSAKSRLLQRVAKLLTPSLYTYPRPAHAIAYTIPKEANEVLPGHTEFIIKQQFASSSKESSDRENTISFTPVDNVRLVKMQAGILLTEHTCYYFNDSHYKIPFAKNGGEAQLKNKIIIGIDVTEYDSDVFPPSIGLYCYNPTYEHEDFVYKLLPYITASCGTQQLPVKKGITYAENNQTLSGYEELFNENSIRTRIEEEIKNIYANKFIEIGGIKSGMVSEGIPDTFGSLSSAEELRKMTAGKRYLWLEFYFPPQYTGDILESFSFIINAFPVYNKGWRSRTSSSKITGNIAPMYTDAGEHFLYPDNVTDSFGNTYTEIPFAQTENTGKGIYTVRTGGIERFDERNAVDMILSVLELTRDEVSAFGVINRDRVVESLKVMTAQMKALNKKVDGVEQNVKQETNYLIVNLTGEPEYIKADYWITNCTLANNMRPGTRLTQQRIAVTGSNKDIVLLTQTMGGNEEQKRTDAIQAYKYALTTRDKIVSAEDIKNFCRLVLKDDVDSVEVKRGTIISNKPKEGFIRTVEIEIIPKRYGLYGKNYWDNTAAELKNQILTRAIDGIEYIVRVTNNDID